MSRTRPASRQNCRSLRTLFSCRVLEPVRCFGPRDFLSVLVVPASFWFPGLRVNFTRSEYSKLFLTSPRRPRLTAWGILIEVQLQEPLEIGIGQVLLTRRIRARPGTEDVAGSAPRDILGPSERGARPGAEDVARGRRRAIFAARLRLFPRAHRPCRFEEVPAREER